MSILNVNKINPVGGGSTITIAGIASVTNAVSVGNSVTADSFHGNLDNSTLLLQTGGTERLRIESDGDVIFKNNGGDNRIERDTTSGGPFILFHNRGTGTTDNSNTYNIGGISAAGYRDVSNPSIVASIQFERQPTASGASSGGNIVFRTGFKRKY